jgi:hypothetical protein
MSLKISHKCHDSFPLGCNMRCREPYAPYWDSPMWRIEKQRCREPCLSVSMLPFIISRKCNAMILSGSLTSSNYLMREIVTNNKWDHLLSRNTERLKDASFILHERIRGFLLLLSDWSKEHLTTHICDIPALDKWRLVITRIIMGCHYWSNNV